MEVKQSFRLCTQAGMSLMNWLCCGLADMVCHSVISDTGRQFSEVEASEGLRCLVE